MKKNFVTFLAIILLTGISCQKQVNNEADKQALIKFTTEDWDKNSRTGDYLKNTNAYTEDAIRIDDEKIYNGKEAIGKLLRYYSETFTFLTAENKAEKVLISGEIATVYGLFSGSLIENKSGDTIYANQAWVDICERQADGTWLNTFTMVTNLND